LSAGNMKVYMDIWTWTWSAEKKNVLRKSRKLSKMEVSIEYCLKPYVYYIFLFVWDFRDCDYRGKLIQ
jgi:hypothetical protein